MNYQTSRRRLIYRFITGKNNDDDSGTGTAPAAGTAKHPADCGGQKKSRVKIKQAIRPAATDDSMGMGG